MLASIILAALIASVPPLAQSPSGSLQVWGFEEDALGRLGSGWIYPEDRGVRVQVLSEGAVQGKRCAVLASGVDRKLAPNGDVVINDAGFFLVRRVDARGYRGREIRLTVILKMEAPSYGPMGSGHLLLQVNGKGGQARFTKNPLDEPIRSTTWTRLESRAHVASDAEELILGVNLLNGYGRLWVDEVRLEILP